MDGTLERHLADVPVLIESKVRFLTMDANSSSMYDDI